MCRANQFWCLSLDICLTCHVLLSPVLSLNAVAGSKNNAAIVDHLDREGIDFLQFAFRWVNCILIREVPFGAAIRLWDTYLAEGGKFSDFLVRVLLLGCGRPEFVRAGW